MRENKVLEFKNPSEVSSELEKVLKLGAEKLLQAGVCQKDCVSKF